MKQNKKGVSPIISTVLLVLIVIILALIIFLWARGFIKEAVIKEILGVEKSADQHCVDVKLEQIINNDGSFGFRNIGNVPIYKFDLKLVDKSGGSEIFEIGSNDGGMVNPGFMTMIENKNYNDYDEVKIIPILLGKGKDGGIKEYRCSESQSILI